MCVNVQRGTGSDGGVSHACVGRRGVCVCDVPLEDAGGERGVLANGDAALGGAVVRGRVVVGVCDEGAHGGGGCEGPVVDPQGKGVRGGVCVCVQQRGEGDGAVCEHVEDTLGVVEDGVAGWRQAINVCGLDAVHRLADRGCLRHVEDVHGLVEGGWVVVEVEQAHPDDGCGIEGWVSSISSKEGDVVLARVLVIVELGARCDDERVCTLELKEPILVAAEYLDRVRVVEGPVFVIDINGDEGCARGAVLVDLHGVERLCKPGWPIVDILNHNKDSTCLSRCPGFDKHLNDGLCRWRWPQGFRVDALVDGNCTIGHIFDLEQAASAVVGYRAVVCVSQRGNKEVVIWGSGH